MLADLLAAAAQDTPQRVAVRDHRASVTYAELHERARGLADALSHRGIEPGQVVAIALPNTSSFVVALFAAALGGTLAAPLHPAAPAAELARELRRLSARAVVTDDRGSALLRDEPDDQLPILRAEGHEATADGAPAGAQPGPDDPVLVQRSSGTTGHAKTIVRTHANLLAEADQLARSANTRPDDVFLGVVPLYHAHGLGNALLASIRARGQLLLLDRFERRRTLEAIVDERVTVFPGVPFMFDILTGVSTGQRVDRTLRLCFSAGAPLPSTVFHAFRERHGTPIRQLYGCTEAGAVTLNLDEDPVTTHTSTGQALDGVRVTISEASPGEIVVDSPATAPGALRDHPGGKALFTGDLGRLDADGRLYVTGRKKVYISTPVHKVDPEEVEAVLRRHPAVQEAVVLGVDDRAGYEAVKAVVVPATEVGREELVAHCRKELADYKVPRVVEFREDLPRSALGKVLRGQLTGA